MTTTHNDQTIGNDSLGPVAYRLGVDVGGTFTDIVLANSATGDLVTTKVPSDAAQPARAVITGVSTILAETGLAPDQIEYFSHGQTFALNTVLQRSGARVGLLVTHGFPDLLHIGRLRLDDPIDLFSAPRRPLVERTDVREISERRLADGTVERALDPAEVVDAATELVDDGVEALAICFLHSHLYPEHEIAALEAIRAAHPGLVVASSTQLWPEEREYERATVAVLGAHVGQALTGYLDQVVRELRTLGLTCPLHITKSNGGAASIAHDREQVVRAAVETLLSGPASGVAGTLRIATTAGIERFITMDMGGTSVDSAIVDGVVPYSTESVLGEFPLIIPSVEVSSIGAGGGSIIGVDAGGVLKVGPRSAGAHPGPAAYGRGGTEPTLTDAYLVCGYLDPADFAAGAITLDPRASAAALQPVAERLGLAIEAVAEAAVAVATAMMHAQLIPLCAQRGVDPSELTLIAYGGAGPVQAVLLARSLNMGEVFVPASPGTLCAYGALVTDLRTDVVAPAGGAVTDDSLAAGWAALEGQARDWYDAQDHQLHTDVSLTRWADVQLVGQSFTLPITLPADAPPTVERLRAAFAEDYHRAYSVHPGSGRLDVRNLRVSLAARTALPEGHPQPAGSDQPIDHQIIENGAQVRAAIHRRVSLAVGDELIGPAVVAAPDTTILIPSGSTGRVDPYGNLRITVGGRP